MFEQIKFSKKVDKRENYTKFGGAAIEDPGKILTYQLLKQDLNFF